MQPFPGRSPSLAMAPQPRCATARLYEKNLEALTRIPAGDIAASRAPGALPTGVVACPRHRVTPFHRKTLQDRHGGLGARLPLGPGE